jgi:hypothetical protein
MDLGQNVSEHNGNPKQNLSFIFVVCYFGTAYIVLAHSIMVSGLKIVMTEHLSTLL